MSSPSCAVVERSSTLHEGGLFGWDDVEALRLSARGLVFWDSVDTRSVPSGDSTAMTAQFSDAMCSRVDGSL